MLLEQMGLGDATGYCLIDAMIDHWDGGRRGTKGRRDCNKEGRGGRLINHSD